MKTTNETSAYDVICQFHQNTSRWNHGTPYNHKYAFSIKEAENTLIEWAEEEDNIIFHDSGLYYNGNLIWEPQDTSVDCGDYTISIVEMVYEISWRGIPEYAATLEKAEDILIQLSLDELIDDKRIEELKEDNEDVSWYKGKGLYDDDNNLTWQSGQLITKDGDLEIIKIK